MIQCFCIILQNFKIIFTELRMLSILLETVKLHLKSFVEYFTQLYPSGLLADISKTFLTSGLTSTKFLLLPTYVYNYLYSFLQQFPPSHAVFAALKTFPLNFLLATYVYIMPSDSFSILAFLYKILPIPISSLVTPFSPSFHIIQLKIYIYFHAFL